MFCNDFSDLPDHELLLQARKYDRLAWEVLHERLKPRLLGWCHSRVRALPSDLYDDVVHETLLMLITGTTTFDANKGHINNHVLGVFLNAVKKVRRASSDSPERPLLYLGIEIEDSGLSIADTVADPHSEAEPSADILHLKEVAQQTVELAMVSAPTMVRDAIILLHSGTYQSVSSVARQLGVNRTTLIRHIRAWSTQREYLSAA